MQRGVVEGIYLAPERAAPTAPVERVRAVPDRGLEGDRHFRPDGAAAYDRGAGKALTLIEAEAVERLASEFGLELDPGEPRRNVVTRGVALNDLVGRRFRVGAVECVGIELCHPCRHMEKLTKQGVLKGLDGRGALNADVLNDCEIPVRDELVDLRAEAAD